jgi:hypothetical protein
VLALRLLSPESATVPESEVTSTSGRLLIGSATHCDLQRDEFEVPVAAVAASYGGAWRMHPLRSVSLRCNGADVQHATAMLPGQTWSIGPVSFRVLSAPSRPDRGEVPRCSIKFERVTDHRPFDIVSLSTTEFLVGSSGICDLQATRTLKLESRHALLTCQSGEWYVHDLTGQGGVTGDYPWSTMARLCHGDEVTIGRLRFTVTCFDRPRGVTATEDTQQAANTQVAAPPVMDDRPPLMGADEQSRMLLRMLIELISRAREQQECPPVTMSLVLRRWGRAAAVAAIEHQAVTGFVEPALQQLRTLLEQDPWDNRLLLTAARIADAAHWDEQCLRLLTLIERSDPRSTLAIRAQARLLTHLGQQQPSLLKKAIGLWRRVVHAAPSEESAIQRTIQDLEVTLTEGELVRRGRSPLSE